ncbi:galactose mutarotase [Bacillus luteolus]|uniref:Aldose 1-epimerase n=1 Tax=Litchfieldia luteola TaxID=682179 RepID=A0ABR9QH84_9BACI|nr:aldose epimerase family protein [Cytobacillus luteolus]MBE4907852.1 galactose mutarotase [Cytobacillus luteolus]MBP1943990.1 aldose 1-epimerase [Cytobacillus luteolus]
MNVTEKIFGSLNGEEIKSYTVTTKKGMEFTCIEYGCIITSIKVPDHEGNIEEIVLGFDTIDEYVDQSPYFGCIIGRNAGRIENASFELDGNMYSLSRNNGEHNLHGGPNGLDTVVWNSIIKIRENEVDIIFSYTSPHGEAGFPGNLNISVTYTINQNNELLISYEANTDQKTIVNLTNHTYFNLSGNLKRIILDHELTLKSDRYLELNSSFIPSGNEILTEGTVFDFRQGSSIKRGVVSNDPQIELVGGGYDHPFLLSTNNEKEIELLDRKSGRKLVIETDEPAVVLYTANSLGENLLIRGRQSENYLGICLETQKPPNRISSFIIEANATYRTKTKYSFQLG